MSFVLHNPNTFAVRYWPQVDSDVCYVFNNLIKKSLTEYVAILDFI